MLNFISPRWAALLFAFVLLVVYCIWPLVIHLTFHADPYFINLASLAGVASCCVVIGAMLPLLDRQFRPGAFRITISAREFHGVLWILFIAFFIVTVATAKAVPFISAITGATEDVLSEQRGNFLIARHGWQTGLVYIGTALTSSLLPYSLARLILDRSKWSLPAGLTLFAFMQASLVKAMFLQVAIPLAYLFATKKRWAAFSLVVALSIGLLLLNTYLQKAQIDVRKIAIWSETIPAKPIATAAQSPSRPTSSASASVPSAEASQPLARPGASYFTSRYSPTSASDHMIWRMIAIPTITAADALRVFDEQFGHKHLLGATSRAVAALFRLERVNYDAHVFAYQWGKSEFGRSNSTYLTEAYVNF